MIKYAYSNMLVHFLKNRSQNNSSALRTLILTGGVIGVNTPYEKVINICTSGLGNRIMSLLTAMYWSSRVRKSPVRMIWFANSECNLNSSDIFDVNPYIIKFVEKDILSDCINYSSSKILDIKDEKNIETLFNFNTTIINNWIVPQYIKETQLIDYIKHIKFKESIYSEAISFVNKNRIDTNVMGLMLRGTDGVHFNIESDIQKWYDYVTSQKNDRFFVMSDDIDIFKKFSVLNNVVVYPTNYFVKYNNVNKTVYRDRQSVIDGIINLLILSRTNILNTTNSSFLKVAKLYSQIKL